MVSVLSAVFAAAMACSDDDANTTTIRISDDGCTPERVELRLGVPWRVDLRNETGEDAELYDSDSRESLSVPARSARSFELEEVGGVPPNLVCLVPGRPPIRIMVEVTD